MPYCHPCRYFFVNTQDLRQHRQIWGCHAADLSPSSTTSTASFGGGAAGSKSASKLERFGSAAPASRPRASDEASKELVGSLQGLYSSGDYSDLVISCRGEEHNVHKAIVCTQSEFVAAACRIGFKETRESKIDLPDDDPWLVHIMVHYLYHFDYDIQQLQRDRLSSGLETDKERTIVNGRITDVLVTHAEVYALAEKYMIRGLKAVALRHFKIAAAAHFVDISDFLQAACEVYTSTVEHDRGLRDVVVETLHSRSNWLVKDEVRDLLNDLGDLAYDLVRYRHQN